MLVSPISLTRFHFLPVVQESKGSFWIFDMSTSLYTSRSLNAKIWVSLRSYLIVIITCLNLNLRLVITKLKFSRTTENFSLLLGILGTGFQDIFSSVCSFQAFFSPVYFHIDFEAITEIVEEPGHPYSYFPRRRFRRGKRFCFC